MDLDDQLEEEHCTICLQPFLDRTIVPVCAHEFCFECILLWSEQSRKCPLCARSYADAYLIHRIRSRHDYQKHYLLPLPGPSSPPNESRAHALRNTRRERQWGRRQRQEREEQDQLERAVARRRWLYQHHLYAKHVASNPYTRYRPFPTPAQFTASQDLISRMTTFLRRELRVWPNLDVEFLTTYTISLMKSIDIRSESAVKLLSEFLDLDTPYVPGSRRRNAEHFAHEIYSYLRSPYRDLNVYDQIVQYDTPPEVSPPRDMDMGCAGSRSDSRRLPRREHMGNSSAEVRCEGELSRRHRRSATPGRDHSSDRSLSPPGGVRDTLLRSHPDTSTSAVVAMYSPVLGDDENGNDQPMADTMSAADTPKLDVPRDDSLAPALAVGQPERTPVNNVDNVDGDSAANSHQSRGRLPVRNRTLSESVQAYLFRPAARHPVRPSADGSTPETRPSLVLRLTDGLLDPDVGSVLTSRQIPVERIPHGGDATSEQTHRRSRGTAVQCVFPPVVNVTPSACAALPSGRTEHHCGSHKDRSEVAVDVSALEARLRARVRVRLTGAFRPEEAR